MILFLPVGPYLSENPDYFDIWLLKLTRPDLIKNLKRIYWFPATNNIQQNNFIKANIENIIVPADGSKDDAVINEINGRYVHYFSDFLNERLIVVLRRLSNKTGYYRKYEERRYLKVEDHDLLFEVFEKIAHLKGTEESEELTKEFVPQYLTKSLFECFCPGATKKLFSDKKYFYIYHSEKILFDKLVSYLESLTKSKARFENVTINIEEQHSPKSNKKINIVVYSSSSSLTQNRKSHLMSQSEELYPNARWIIFNESSNNPTSDFLPEYCEIITLPDYEQIKTNHSLTEIFYLLLIEFARVNNQLISYSTFDVNGDKLINTFFSPFDSLTDMYNILKEIHPSGNFTIHSWQPDYWYNLLSAQKRIAENKSDEDKPIEIDFKSKELSADQSKTELTSAISDKKVPKIVEGSETQYPNRFEKNDELISIYYNGFLIPHINSALIGLRYIYLIIKYANSTNPISTLQLSQLISTPKKKDSFLKVVDHIQTFDPSENKVTTEDDSESEFDVELKNKTDIIDDKTALENEHEEQFQDEQEGENSSVNTEEYEEEGENSSVNTEEYEEEGPSSSGLEDFAIEETPPLRRKMLLAKKRGIEQSAASLESVYEDKLRLNSLEKQKKNIDKAIENFDQRLAQITNPDQKKILNYNKQQKKAEQKRVERLISELKGTIKLKEGQLKSISTAVISSINRAFKNIEKGNSLVGIHIRNSIKPKGSSYSYEPDDTGETRFYSF